MTALPASLAIGWVNLAECARLSSVSTHSPRRAFRLTGVSLWHTVEVRSLSNNAWTLPLQFCSGGVRFFVVLRPEARVWHSGCV